MKALIYVLDDDAVTAEICAEMLGGLDCGVRVFHNLNGFIRTVQDKAPDVVFFDVLTAGVDGLKVSKLLREDLQLPGVKLVVMEGKSAAKVSAHNVIADAYLAKPFALDQLQAVLNQLSLHKAEVRFWGVRGSIAAPGVAHDRYGGNTSCVTLKLSLDEYIIFDAGTGIREFGNYLVRLGLPMRMHLMISHAHWDHIQGLPFFRPGYLEKNDLALYGCNQGPKPFEQVIADQMQNTYFPVPLETMKANLHFQNWQEGKYKVSEAEVETLFLHHPGNCLGFRASLRGKSMVYLCDNELTDNQAEFRTRLRTFLNKTDLLVADAQYTPADFPAKRGWGHSLYTDVVDIAMDAKVRRLALTHHDPDRNDDALDAIVADSRRRIAERGMHMECFAAQEGSAVFL